MNKPIKMVLAGVVLAAAGTGGYGWWQHSQLFRSTENAYINADIVQVAAQVSGPLVSVHVHEGDLAKAGQPLFDIDPAPFQVVLEQAEAKLAQAEQDNHQDHSDVASNEAAVNQAEAVLANTRSTAQRMHDMRQKGFVSQQDDDNSQAQVRVAQAALDQAQARLSGAQTKVAAVGKATPAVLAARAAVAQARLDLEHTHVAASKDGWIANISLVPGSAIVAGAPLFSLIVRDSFWVDANFKETELPGIQAGQDAEVDIDMQPGHPYQGYVQTIGYGTGAAFSLLPAQNATGNWVKVTQRVPVRIRLRDEDGQAFRVGASALVKVRLKS